MLFGGQLMNAGFVYRIRNLRMCIKFIVILTMFDVSPIENILSSLLALSATLHYQKAKLSPRSRLQTTWMFQVVVMS
jgi:hypothetical protein